MNKWIDNPDVDKQYVHCGRSYVDDDDNDDDEGWAMLLFQVDTNAFIFMQASPQHEFGGTTSIQVEDEEVFRTIMIFDQDKVAFHQFMSKAKIRASLNSEWALLAKSDGIAKMTFAFISLYMGLVLEIDTTML